MAKAMASGSATTPTVTPPPRSEKLPPGVSFPQNRDQLRLESRVHGDPAMSRSDGRHYGLDRTLWVLDALEGAAIPFGQIGRGTIRRFQEFEQRVIRRFRLP